MDPVRQFFDDIGDGEWDRFDKDARSQVALEVHRRFLRRHDPEGSHVLEIGAGQVASRSNSPKWDVASS